MKPKKKKNQLVVNQKLKNEEKNSIMQAKKLFKNKLNL